MTYKLSQRSLDRMEGVDERLVAVAKAAIGHTKTDFGVISELLASEGFLCTINIQFSVCWICTLFL